MDFQAHLEKVAASEPPETEYEWHEEEMIAGHINIGDELVNHGYEKVGSMKSGTKWTEVFDGDGKKIFRVPNDMTILVARTRPTETSRLADRRWAANSAIARELLRDMNIELDRVRSQLDNTIEKGWPIRYDIIDDLLIADAKLQVARRRRAAVEFIMLQDGFDGDLVDAHNEYIDELKDQIATGYHNRSSNQVSNLMDDILLDAMRNVAREARWLR